MDEVVGLAVPPRLHLVQGAGFEPRLSFVRAHARLEPRVRMHPLRRRIAPAVP
jgi:hypothetical protein